MSNNLASFCFVHAADLHLDTTFQGIGKVSAEVARSLRDASILAFDNLIELVIKKEASFLLLAGDIYNSSVVGLRAQLRMQEGFLRLAERGISVFMVSGNHDPLNSQIISVKWPDNVFCFSAETVEGFDIVFNNQKLAHVYGISYASSEVRENLVEKFPSPLSDSFNIALLHANISAASDMGSYSQCTIKDFLNKPFNYWALGHQHNFQVLNNNFPSIVYPGCIQGLSLKPSECGAKGAAVINVIDGNVQSIEFARCDEIVFEQCPTDISNCESIDEIVCCLKNKLSVLESEHDKRSIVVRLILTGRTSLCKKLRERSVLEDLITHLQSLFSTSERFIWIESIVNETKSEIDKEAVSKRDDFLAALVKQSLDIWTEIGQTEILKNKVYQQLSILGIEEKYGITMSLEEEKELYFEALDRALELFEE